MPFCQFVKPYPGYSVGQVVDLPGRLSYKLRTAGVVVKADAPVIKVTGPVTDLKVTKHPSKKAAKKAK